MEGEIDPRNTEKRRECEGRVQRRDQCECNGDGLLRARYQAEAGNVQSQVNLGVLYVRGVEQLQDFEQAHMWFNIAASTGHALAQKYRDTRNYFEAVFESELRRPQ